MKPGFKLTSILLLAPLIAICADGQNIRIEVIHGRSWLIGSAGMPFFPHGVNHIAKHGTGANPKETAGEKKAADDAKFLRLIARQYFKVVGEAPRKNDPNHLFFGDRFMFATVVPVVMEEMLPYVDAIAIQRLYTPVFPSAVFLGARSAASTEVSSSPRLYL